jgi:hypothetical protein
MVRHEVTPMVKRLSCLPSKQAARVRLPFGVLHPEYRIFFGFQGSSMIVPSLFLFVLLSLGPPTRI